MVEHVEHIPFSPDHSVAAVEIKETVVSVFAFCDIPFVEIFAHHHETHLVAKLYQFLCRHVVRCPDGVASHVLQHSKLSAYRCLVDSRAEGTKVVVQADSTELAAFPVEEKAFVGNYLYGAEAEACGHFILKDRPMSDAYLRSLHVPCCFDCTSCIYLCFRIIECRILRRPQFRIFYSEILRHLTVVYRGGVEMFRHFLSIGILDSRYKSHSRVVFNSCNLCLYAYGCVIIIYIWSSHICAPYRDMYCRQGDVTHLSVETGSRVPA